MFGRLPFARCSWSRTTGTGFDPTQPVSPQTFGMQSMRERAESLGGEFRLESTPGKGTTVQVSVSPAGRSSEPHGS